ncbi:hypothetical protein ACFU99_14285 [Streptomyces sp. NPDC057654]|uniref:hypothetical protein n=1 Tax=Streptomyces sp. NPDC057654 TaxID=3346196 RepID=UPI0036C4722D
MCTPLVQPTGTDHEDSTDGTCRDGMGWYEVIVVRSERITFTLRADSVQDAEERYLLDGEETSSESLGQPDVESVKQLEGPPPA